MGLCFSQPSDILVWCGPGAGLILGKEDATRPHTAAEKGKAKVIEHDEALYQTSAFSGAYNSDEAGPSQPQVDLHVGMAVQGPSSVLQPTAMEPMGLFDGSFGTQNSGATHESTSEEDTTGRLALPLFPAQSYLHACRGGEECSKAAC